MGKAFGTRTVFGDALENDLFEKVRLTVKPWPLTRTKEIILDGGMGALLASVEVDSSPLWSGIANINSRDVVIDAHQVKFRQRTHFEKFINEKFIYISFRNLSTLGPMR